MVSEDSGCCLRAGFLRARNALSDHSCQPHMSELNILWERHSLAHLMTHFHMILFDSGMHVQYQCKPQVIGEQYLLTPLNPGEWQVQPSNVCQPVFTHKPTWPVTMLMLRNPTRVGPFHSPCAPEEGGGSWGYPCPAGTY